MLVDCPTYFDASTGLPIGLTRQIIEANSTTVGTRRDAWGPFGPVVSTKSGLRAMEVAEFALHAFAAAEEGEGIEAMHDPDDDIGRVKIDVVVCAVHFMSSVS